MVPSDTGRKAAHCGASVSYQVNIVTGSTANQLLGQRAPSQVAAVRVGGTANLVGTITVRNGATVIDTIPAASTPGTSREYYGVVFGSGLAVQLSNAGDTAVVIWGPA